MFDLVRAIILGIVQGATEFIPISSSGHLIIVPWLLGWESHGLLFDTVLHWGTLVSIFFVFWREFVVIVRESLLSLVHRSLADPNARLGWYIVVGSIPAAVIGLLFEDFFERLFESPVAAGGFLLVTAALLVGSEQLAKRFAQTKSTDQMTWSDAIVVGVAQACALAPGISRSGSTIAAGLALGLRRDSAARYSFLLGTPAFFGAGLLQVSDALAADPATVIALLPALIVGFLASAIAGVLAIRFLLAYLRHRSLYVFAVYCVVVGVLVLALGLL